ncbi:MAG: glycosyltransferase family 2 protein [Candidatus Neomarinimicrobiota bacterium]
MKGIILISAYNAEETLPDVLNELSKFKDLEILVVNDGSTDQTSDLVVSAGVKLLSHDKNRGKGAALQKGFEYASKMDIDFLITFDADKQHPADHINNFIDMHRLNPGAIILGSRKRDKNMPWTRKFSNSVSATLTSLRTGQKLYDVQCGFRLIPKKYLSWKLSRINGFIFENEMLIAWADNNIKLISIDIPTIYSTKHKSRMTYLDSTFGFISMFIKSFFKSYKQDK